jgi:Carbohydrate esterase 2 N-terminal
VAATGAAALLFGTSSVAVAAAASSASSSTSLYVSPTGSGTACSAAAPCSLSQARTEVRALAPSMTGDIDIELLGGTYRLTSTFQLGPQDSGENGHNVVYQAAAGQTPVITGAEQVTGWSEYDPSKGIYRAAVPVGTQSSQLFVNGVRAQRARSALNPSGFTLSGSSFVTSDSSYASFTNQSQIQIVDDNDWKQMRCPLSSITATSSGGSSLNVNPTCFANNNTNVPNAGFPFNGSGLPALNGISWIENAYQLLSQPGQFYLDSGAGYLYYIPLSGQSMATADVELPTQQELVDLSGTPGHLSPQLYNASGVSYSGTWAVSSGRPDGDLGNAVEYTQTNGDSATFSFTGTGIQVLSETNSDEGTIDVYVDGTKTETVNADSATRVAQQAIVDVSGLSQGAHTVKLVKTGGQYMLVDAYTVTPNPVAAVHNIQFDGITFTGTTWTQPDSTGYIDNQAGVLWAPGTTTPQLIPAAVQVHRGDDVQFDSDVFDHLGGAGIDYADGTQNSTISGDQISDVSAGGVLLGEVDDYYLADTKLMTSGDVVTQNVIQHVGQDYHDAVGVWAGYTEDATISNNDIGYTPYSGISLGWGWGWQSDCTLQAKQGLSTPCRHGTNYAGGNQITDNFIHNVMGILHDGGPIYTNGGQGLGTGVSSAPCQQTSVLAGNVVADGNGTNNMLYQDEGSSCWNTYDNVAEFGGNDWIGMWTPTINDIDIHDNYSDNSAYYDNGTGITFNQATIVTGGAWPSAARQIMAAAGPTSEQGLVATAGVVDDDSLAISYTGTWADSGFRGDGDYADGVHYTQTNGDQATLTFEGTQVSFATETNSDEGTFEVLVDGVNQGTFNAAASTRHAQQTLFTSSVLSSGKHTVTVVKESGTYLLVDDFTVK